MVAIYSCEVHGNLLGIVLEFEGCVVMFVVNICVKHELYLFAGNIFKNGWCHRESRKKQAGKGLFSCVSPPSEPLAIEPFGLTLFCRSNLATVCSSTLGSPQHNAEDNDQENDDQERNAEDYC